MLVNSSTYITYNTCVLIIIYIYGNLPLLHLNMHRYSLICNYLIIPHEIQVQQVK